MSVKSKKTVDLNKVLQMENISLQSFILSQIPKERLLWVDVRCAISHTNN